MLYGTAQAYEINSGLENGGTVFSLTPPAEAGGPWVEATVYNFPPSGKQYPATVTLGANGVLYGTTNLG